MATQKTPQRRIKFYDDDQFMTDNNGKLDSPISGLSKFCY